MKIKTGILLTCAIFMVSSYSFAGGCCADSCGDIAFQDGDYTSSCDCTDPNCGPKGYNDCMSANKCCEAFGNVGGR